MQAVGCGNTKILTDHVLNHPWTLGHLLKARLAGEGSSFMLASFGPCVYIYLSIQRQV